MTQPIQPSTPAASFRCFGADAGHGNPALVVLNGPTGTDQRQQYARDHAATCVFADAASPPGADYLLDFYYPHARSPLCVHAAVAAAALLAHERPVTVKTAMRGQDLELRRSGDTFGVTLKRQGAPDVMVEPGDLRQLLGNPTLGFAAVPRVASVGSPKLLVQVNDAGVLYRLKPDLAAISAWGREHGVNGIYAFWVCGDGEVEGRNFNHLDPALEDTATGVAAGALTVLFGRALRVHQGAAQGNPCLIVTGIDGDAVTIGGRVSAIS